MNKPPVSSHTQESEDRLDWQQALTQVPTQPPSHSSVTMAQPDASYVPTRSGSRSVVQDIRGVRHQDKTSFWSRLQGRKKKSREAKLAMLKKAKISTKPVPGCPGWVQIANPNSGLVTFYNKKLKKKSYQKPTPTRNKTKKSKKSKSANSSPRNAAFKIRVRPPTDQEIANMPTGQDSPPPPPPSLPPPPETIRRLQLEQMGEKRVSITEEIISTEIEYVTGLSIAINSFVAKVTQFCKTNYKDDPKILDFVALLETYTLIWKSNVGFLKSMQQLRGVGVGIDFQPKRITEMFVDFEPFFKTYATYGGIYTKSARLIREVNGSEYPPLKSLINNCLKSPVCEGIPLHSFLNLPVRRIPQYRSMLTDLVKHTRRDDELYKEFERAKAIVDDTVAEMSGAKISLQELAQKFESNPRFYEEGRTLVRQGALLKMEEAGGEAEYRFFLFNNLFAYASVNNGRYRLARAFSIHEKTTVTPIDSRIREHCFKITSNTDTLVVVCWDQQSYDDWCFDIHSCIQQDMDNNIPQEEYEVPAPPPGLPTNTPSQVGEIHPRHTNGLRPPNGLPPPAGAPPGHRSGPPPAGAPPGHTGAPSSPTAPIAPQLNPEDLAIKTYDLNINKRPSPASPTGGMGMGMMMGGGGGGMMAALQKRLNKNKKAEEDYTITKTVAQSSYSGLFKAVDEKTASQHSSKEFIPTLANDDDDLMGVDDGMMGLMDDTFDDEQTLDFGGDDEDGRSSFDNTASLAYPLEDSPIDESTSYQPSSSHHQHQHSVGSANGSDDDSALNMDTFSLNMDSLMSDDFEMDFDGMDGFDGIGDESDQLLSELLENGDFDSDIEDVLADSKDEYELDLDSLNSGDTLESDSLRILADIIEFSADIQTRGMALSIDPRQRAPTLTLRDDAGPELSPYYDPTLFFNEHPPLLSPSQEHEQEQQQEQQHEPPPKPKKKKPPPVPKHRVKKQGPPPPVPPVPAPPAPPSESPRKAKKKPPPIPSIPVR